jgi:hypothetical protein
MPSAPTQVDHGRGVWRTPENFIIQPTAKIAF